MLNEFWHAGIKMSAQMLKKCWQCHTYIIEYVQVVKKNVENMDILKLSIIKN